MEVIAWQRLFAPSITLKTAILATAVTVVPRNLQPGWLSVFRSAQCRPMASRRCRWFCPHSYWFFCWWFLAKQPFGTGTAAVRYALFFVKRWLSPPLSFLFFRLCTAQPRSLLNRWIRTLLMPWENAGAFRMFYFWRDQSSGKPAGDWVGMVLALPGDWRIWGRHFAIEPGTFQGKIM